MVEEARKRLRWLGYVAVAASLFFFTIGRIANPDGPPDGRTAMWVYGSLLTLILGGGFLATIASWERVPAFLVLRFAILYQYLGAFALQALRLCDESHQMMYTDTAYDMLLPWIVLFGFSIPARARIAFPVSLITATMAPLCYAVFLQRGDVSSLSAMGWLIRFFPVYATAVITAVLSVNFYSLGRRLESAKMVGSYKLTDLIGRGGMGEVWRAEHRLLSRCSAIKLVKPEVVGEGSGDSRGAQTALLRFEREAQATAALRSPHSVEIYDFGITQDGNFYYVMELLDGMDLDTLVKRFGPQPAERVISFLLQVCDSLSEAHDLGLIHRDVKPKNIFVCRLGRNFDFIKVLDFGLVKNTARRQDQSLTQEGTTAGTPAYLAPEVARGSKDIDGRSDLYSLGCVAYWLLTGQTVFEGSTAVATILKHVTETPVPPSERTENRVPHDLEAVVMQCLEKDSAKRPQSAEELSQLLANCQDATEWGRTQAQGWWQQYIYHGDGRQPNSCSATDVELDVNAASDSRAATMH
jgi:eukaryotic-like serine/threonine-protein kinase